MPPRHGQQEKEELTHGLSPLSPTISRGDALFLHHLLAHAGSCNAGDRPRFALNMKW